MISRLTDDEDYRHVQPFKMQRYGNCTCSHVVHNMSKTSVQRVKCGGGTPKSSKGPMMTFIKLMEKVIHQEIDYGKASQYEYI